MRLQNEVAIITGGGSGIGKEIAIQYAKEGAHLVLNTCNFTKEQQKSLINDISQDDSEILIVDGDITNEEVINQLVETALNRFGKIDILVNSAGILTQELIQNMRVETWDQMINVDLKAVFLTTRAVVNQMIGQKSGRIINIASQIGQKGGYELSHYAAAKAGVIGFTKSIAIELGQHGITANCIAPGPIETDIIANIDEEWKFNKRKELALPRFGLVQEVAPTAVFLAAKPDGNIFTGQTLGPNSGDVML